MTTPGGPGCNEEAEAWFRTTSVDRIWHNNKETTWDHSCEKSTHWSVPWYKVVIVVYIYIYIYHILVFCWHCFFCICSYKQLCHTNTIFTAPVVSLLLRHGALPSGWEKELDIHKEHVPCSTGYPQHLPCKTLQKHYVKKAFQVVIACACSTALRCIACDMGGKCLWRRSFFSATNLPAKWGDWWQGLGVSRTQ